MFEFITNYKYRRQLKKAREEAQLIFDYAAKKREDHPDGIYRDIVDFMTTRERRVYHEIMREEWALSKLLGEQPQWGSAKMLYVDVDDEATPAATNVKYNRSSKVTWEYDAELDGYVKVRDGERDTAQRWVMVDGVPKEPKEWEEFTPFTPRAAFERDWKYNQTFHDAVDEFHAAETDEEKQAVIDKYKEDNPDAIY